MSAKNCDNHNRFRDRTIGFRVSSEEEQQINTVVELSGMTKQDYIVSKLLDRTIYGTRQTLHDYTDNYNRSIIETKQIQRAN